MTVLRSLLKRESFGGPDPGPGGPFIPSRPLSTMASPSVTESSALTQSTVFACVRLVSEAVSTLPVDAFRRTPGGRQHIDVPVFVDRPHPEMPRHEWLGRMLISLLLRGNAYGLVVGTNPAGWPTAVKPIHPDDVKVARNKTGQLEYQFRGGPPTLEYPLGDAVHVRGITVAGADVGLSPVTYARTTIGLALAAERFGSALFTSGGNPSGTLKVPQTLTKEQAEDMKDSWEAANSGPTRRPAVLSGGTSWEAVSLTPDDSQFLGTREASAYDVCQWFGVPPPLVGLLSKQSSWAASIEALGIQFVTYGLVPWIVRLERLFTDLLPKPQYVKFNVNGLMRADMKTRYESYAIARQWGWKTGNEVRHLEDEDPAEGLDVFLSPLNMASIPPGTPLPGPPTPKPEG